MALGQTTDQLADAGLDTSQLQSVIDNNTGQALTDAILLVVPGDPDGSQVGTIGADIITGAGGNDVIEGLDGNDTLSGLAGNDTIRGGAGNDREDGNAQRLADDALPHPFPLPHPFRADGMAMPSARKEGRRTC